MRLLGNILWHFPCFGFVTSLFSFLAGILLTVTVVGAPIGLGLIQYAKFALAPYSYSMIDKRELHPNKSGNILYAILCLIVRILYFPLGVLFFLWGIAQVVVMCCTIVLLPMAIPYAKSLSTFFNPVGKVCVPVAVMDELERRKAEKEVDAYLIKTHGYIKSQSMLQDSCNEKILFGFAVLRIPFSSVGGRCLVLG